MKRSGANSSTSWTRRRFIGTAGLAALATALPRIASAAGTAVPLALQTELVSKVAKYDRNLAGEIRGAVKVHILEVDNAESRGASSRLASAFGAIDTIAGMSVGVSRVEYTSASSLADACRNQAASIVYVTPGMEAELGGIGAALSGISVLTVGALPSHVESGVVLGFDLVEGSPKILVHLGRARAQHVSFKPALLKLAKIIE